MVQHREFFMKNLEMLEGYIQNEQKEKKKSSMVLIALKCLFDSLSVNGFLLQNDESTE